jgi:hypothetical protein
MYTTQGRYFSIRSLKKKNMPVKEVGVGRGRGERVCSVAWTVCSNPSAIHYKTLCTGLLTPLPDKQCQLVCKCHGDLASQMCNYTAASGPYILLWLLIKVVWKTAKPAKYV